MVEVEREEIIYRQREERVKQRPEIKGLEFESGISVSSAVVLTRAMNSAFNVRLELSCRVARVIEHASFTSDMSITCQTTLRLTFPHLIF